MTKNDLLIQLIEDLQNLLSKMRFQEKIYKYHIHISYINVMHKIQELKLLPYKNP